MNQTSGADSIHLVGSIAMDDCEQVFREISAELGPYLDKIPDGETGERARWIYFQRTMLMEHPAMEIDPTVPELALHQWDGKLLRSLPLLRFRENINPDEVEFATGYDKAAEYSYGVFKRLREEGVIPCRSPFPGMPAHTHGQLLHVRQPQVLWRLPACLPEIAAECAEQDTRHYPP